MSVRSPVLDGSGTRDPRACCRHTTPPSPARPAAARPRRARSPRPRRCALVGYAAILTALVLHPEPGPDGRRHQVRPAHGPGRVPGPRAEALGPQRRLRAGPEPGYGYAWPMGPFFALGAPRHMPPWMVQRLWWALLLCLAFFGMLRLCRAARDRHRADAGSSPPLAFVLTPRFTTLSASVSVEVWPMALAPWVLLPLVKGSRAGLGTPRGGLQCAGGRLLWRRERGRRRRGAAARRRLAAHPSRRAAAVAAAGLVDAVHGAGHRVVERSRCCCSAATRRRSSTTSRTPPSPPCRPT